MRDSTVPLHRYPARTVHLACRSCSRKGSFTKATLIRRFGPGESLVTLRMRIAEGWGCRIATAVMAGHPLAEADRCGVHYPGLSR